VDALNTIAVHPCEQYCSDALSAEHHYVSVARPVTIQKKIKKVGLRGFLRFAAADFIDELFNPSETIETR